MRFACVLLSPNDEYLQISFAEACLRFSPEIALGSRTIILEIGKCSSLYSEDSFLKRMQVLLKRFGISARVSIAADIPSAFAFALHGITDIKNPFDSRSLPVEALYCYYSPFTFDLTLQRMMSALRKLGIETLGEFVQLPHASITKNFGKEGLLALRRFLHAHQVIWNRFQVSEKVIDHIDVESHEALYDYEQISFLLKRILDRILLRTRGLGKLISKMKLKLHLDTYSDRQESDREWCLEFSFPHRSARAFLEMIRDRVGADFQNRPLAAPVLRVELEVLEMVKGNSSQSQLFSQQEEEQESVDLLIERMMDKLGDGKVFYAAPAECFIPERSWQKTMRPQKTSERVFRSRPLKLFLNPEPIRKLDQYFFLREHRWLILKLVGPERITGDWWIGDQARDYYEAHTENEILWVYGDPLHHEMFLHGVFD